MFEPKEKKSGEDFSNEDELLPMIPLPDSPSFSVSGMDEDRAKRKDLDREASVDIAKLLKNLPGVRKVQQFEEKDGVIFQVETEKGLGITIQTDGKNVTSYGISMEGEPMQYHDISGLNVSPEDFINSLGDAIRNNSGEKGILQGEKTFKDFFEGVQRDLESKYPSHGVSDKPCPISL